MSTKTKSVNVSQILRQLFDENKAITLAECEERIHSQFPRLKINKNSLSVGFYTIRRKMGVSGVNRRSMGIRSQTVESVSVDINKLKLTANFLREMGSADDAIDVIKKVQSVQI